MNPDFHGTDALLLVGDSERNADLYYATRFRAPDPFVFVWTSEEKIMMISELELDRARSQAQVDRVLARSRYEQRLKKKGRDAAGFDDLLIALLDELKLKRLGVPTDFPLGTAEALRKAGFLLEIIPSPFFPQRQIKTEAEIEAIRRSVQAAERGMQAAVELLRRSEARKGVLYFENQILTSERVRRQIHFALMEQACTARHTIVAGGDQGCDPHQIGTGPLHPNETIIIDIFPQSDLSGYFGDLTRTLVKGEAPEEIKRLYDTVLRGQELALERIRDGIDGKVIHSAIQELFLDAGYETGEKEGHLQGFFHGTGHGLGLEIHEEPRIGTRSQRLRAGHVVTVEPGLYYPGVGGIRIEDVVVVRFDGCENLTSFPKFLEI